MTRARLAFGWGFAAMTLAFGGPALAQLPPASPGLCSPPCGVGEVCAQGQCVVPPPAGDWPAAPPPVAPAPPPPPPPAPAPPPAYETTEPAPPPPPPAPPPAPRKRQRPAPPPKPVVEEEDDDEPEAWRRGVLVLPFFGFHAVEGIAANDYDAGARAGLLVGVHASPIVSLNIELAMDFLSPKTSSDPALRTSLSGHDFTAAFSPLFHASNGIGELVVGPKLGFWSSNIESSTPLDTVDKSQAGWAFGFNAGGFAGVTDTAALGAIVSYQMTYLSQTCRSNNTGTDCTLDGSAPQFLSFNVAALF